MRARLVTEWLGVMAVRQFAMAWVLWSDHVRYDAAQSFVVLLGLLPMTHWAVIWAMSGVLAVAAIASRQIPLYIIAIVASATLTGYWVLACVLAKVEIRDASKLLIVLFATLTVKDLLLLRAVTSKK